MNGLLNFLFDAFAIGVVFLYGSVGEILTEKSGHLNLGIPGVMCTGAMASCVSIAALHGAKVPGALVVIVGIAAGFAGGALMGALYSFLTVTLHANQNVTGLVLTTFGVGLSKFIMPRVVPESYLYAKEFFRFPFAGRSDSLQYCGVMFFLAIAIAIAASVVMKKTRVGLNLRAVGENPATADAAGVSVPAYRFLATMIGCGIAGLGGIYYILDVQGSQEAYLSIEPLGWLAVALVIFALWRPYLSIFGSFVFGAFFIIAQSITRVGWLKVDLKTTTLLEMLPYVITLVVLIVTSVHNKKENQPPAALGVNYFREER